MAKNKRQKKRTTRRSFAAFWGFAYKEVIEEKIDAKLDEFDLDGETLKRYFRELALKYLELKEENAKLKRLLLDKDKSA